MSVNLLKSPSLRSVACALGLAVVGNARGDGPPKAPEDQGAPQIELWHGSHRVDLTTPLEDQAEAHVELWNGTHRVDPWAPHESTQARNVSARAILTGADHGVTVGWPRPLGEGPPFARWPKPRFARGDAPLISRPAPWLSLFNARLVDVPERPAKVVVVSESKKALPKLPEVARPRDLSEAQETHYRAERQIVPIVLPRDTTVVTAPESATKMIVQAITMAVVAIAASLISIVCFFWLLRRHSRLFGPLARIDSVGAAPTVIGPFTATANLPVQDDSTSVPALDRGTDIEALKAEQPSASADAEAPHVAESFDVGPSFADVRRLQEAQARQAEEAVLQHLFEQNMQLRDAIERAQNPAGGAHDVITEGSDLSLGIEGDKVVLRFQGDDDSSPYEGRN